MHMLGQNITYCVGIKCTRSHTRVWISQSYTAPWCYKRYCNVASTVRFVAHKPVVLIVQDPPTSAAFHSTHNYDRVLIAFNKMFLMSN